MTAPAKQVKQRGSRLLRELAFLFGRQVVAESERISIDAMAAEAELVAEGARQLIQHKGQPEAQRRIVQGMDDDTALALCKWIREPQAVGRWMAQQ